MKHTNHCILAALLLAGFCLSMAKARAESRSVAGEWGYRLDPAKAGQKENWFAKALSVEADGVSGTLPLPGTLDTAGVAPNKETPMLKRLYRATKYVGPAWYERQVEIPASWEGRRITLFLERVHCQSEAWLDGRSLGTQTSISAPHSYELGVVTQGTHRLTLWVNNVARHDIGGTWATSVGEETQVNWNGVIGRMELQATDPVYLADVQVYPEVARKQARVVVEIGNATGKAGEGKLKAEIGKLKSEIPVTWNAEGGHAQFEMDLGAEARPWDEFSPAMQELAVSLGAERKVVRFGMRQFEAKGRQLTINDRPVFLRGNLEHCIQPLTGYPPMEVEPWRKIFRVMKTYGLNMARFHSWCPPEAAFAAADEEGVYLLPEAGAWYHNAGALPERDQWMAEEAMRILKAYGNHPSFCLFTLGNELGGEFPVLDAIVERMTQADPRRLYSASTGLGRQSPVRKAEQFRVADVRGMGDSPSTIKDFRDELTPFPFPIIAHELGQAMVFPDVAEIPKYTGVLKPKNLEMIRDDLARHGLLEQAHDFVEATGKLSALQYKGVIEEELRTPGIGGFALLDLQDFPGQGTSTIGMLNAFWESKGLVTPELWRGFCSETVPLLRFEKRVFTTEETFTATAEVAHYGPRDLSGIEPAWKISDERGHELAAGRFPSLTLPTGHLTPLGKLEVPLGAVTAPCTLTVSVSLPGTPYVNRWDIHVYPVAPAPQPPADVVVLRTWGPEAKAALAAGRKVFLQILPETYENAFRGQFRVPFWSSVFWGSTNETTGGLFDAAHPAFALFPTERYRDFRWADLTGRSVSLLLDPTPAAYRSIAQVIDNHGHNRKIGTLFEAKVGPGRLLACGFNVWDDLKSRPEARQLARSLYAYLGSEAFAPKQTLEEATLDQVFRKLVEGNSGRMGVRVAFVDSEAPGFPAANLLDGNSKTCWHSADVTNAPVYPKEIVLELPNTVSLRGCKLVASWGGRLKGYAVYTREENTDWIQAARGECLNDEASHTALFAAPRRARAVKLVLLSGFDPKALYAALAEIELLPADK